MCARHRVLCSGNGNPILAAISLTDREQQWCVSLGETCQLVYTFLYDWCIQIMVTCQWLSLSMEKHFHPFLKDKCEMLKHVGSQCFKIRIPVQLSPSMPCQRSSQRKHHQSCEQSYQTVNKEPRNTSMTGQSTWETASETRTVTAEARNPIGSSLWCYLQNIHSAPALWRAVSASLRSAIS